MDFSIRKATDETYRELGAVAFDLGLSEDDHGMADDNPARKHWQAGYHDARVAAAIKANPLYPMRAKGVARRAES